MFALRSKKIISSVLATIIMASGVVLSMPAKASANTDVTLTVTYNQTDARAMLKSINDWRKNGATYKDPDGNNVTPLKSDALTYDYNLEKIAMERAAEIVILFDHTRPDGTTDRTYGSTKSYGENIAFGQKTYTDAFTAFKEDSLGFDGQGHRRSMLGDVWINGSRYEKPFTAIGIACVEYNGVKYWVQEFGYSNSGASKTSAFNGDKTVTINSQTAFNDMFWINVDGNWYYCDRYGYAKTGWNKIDGKWYYMNSKGVMQTGWQYVGGKWYFLNSSGAMVTGWLYSGGKWYYLTSSGAMATGWLKEGNTWYYMNSSGAMTTGWQYVGGAWYYMYGSGAMATGWIQDGGRWYYLYPSGAMASNTWIGNYYVDGSGAWTASR